MRVEDGKAIVDDVWAVVKGHLPGAIHFVRLNWVGRLLHGGDMLHYWGIQQPTQIPGVAYVWDDETNDGPLGGWMGPETKIIARFADQRQGLDVLRAAMETKARFDALVRQGEDLLLALKAQRDQALFAALTQGVPEA
ncbi:hypothetical protein CcrKarma_gp264 [Caulobacter virus Karma]|uniref:hypothetical protein n=1 Tax=Caulobacter virus Karma TaxID=1211641 RepID=UPI00028AACF7|nr:hypothetical protein CcrKarma_gp264 [Caulobacter virus Karma]AFU87781.1 hypothetical protein CcrKarma_gp264 [Caulobacter virus Karma]